MKQKEGILMMELGKMMQKNKKPKKDDFLPDEDYLDLWYSLKNYNSKVINQYLSITYQNLSEAFLFFFFCFSINY